MGWNYEAMRYDMICAEGQEEKSQTKICNKRADLIKHVAVYSSFRRQVTSRIRAKNGENYTHKKSADSESAVFDCSGPSVVDRVQIRDSASRDPDRYSW